MILPIFTSTLILGAVIAFFSHKSKNDYAREMSEFWEKERAANSTRRKSLDGLDYISIPIDELPINTHRDNDNIAACIDTIVELSKSPIVNLTGISNTDLKLKYGAPNITQLTLYDQRYTLLASTLQKWADALLKCDDRASAKSVLEFAVSTKTDVSASYRMLADIYKAEHDADSIRALIPVAESLNTPLKSSILDYLNESLNA